LLVVYFLVFTSPITLKNPLRCMVSKIVLPMSSDREGMRRRLRQIIEVFSQKGPTSPEKAMNIQELGLPPRFPQAMNRRLGPRIGVDRPLGCVTQIFFLCCQSA